MTDGTDLDAHAEQLDPELRERSRADECTPLELGLTRILGHQPEMAKGLGRFTSSLKANRTLPERLIELVRLRIVPQSVSKLHGHPLSRGLSTG